MKKIVSIVCFCLLLITTYSYSFAAPNVSGSASISYKDGLFSSKSPAELQEEAVQKALITVWKKYTTTFSPAKYKAYIGMEQVFTDHLDQYIASYKVIDEKNNKDNKQYIVAIKATINEVAVEAKLGSASAAGNTASGDGSMFSFIFVARDVASVKSYKAKVTKVGKAEARIMNEEKSAMADGTMVSGKSQKVMAKVTTGGSSERKADKIKYVVSSAADVDAAMNEILSPAGFEVVDYADIVSECGGAEPAVIKDEFSKQAELSRSVRKEAISGARICEVPLFAIGTLDAGMEETDPASGLKKVYVSVNAKVYNIEKRLPKKVASVGPVQYAGVGPSATVAKRNALSKAAKSAAKAIVDQLNAKNLK